MTLRLNREFPNPCTHLFIPLLILQPPVSWGGQFSWAPAVTTVTIPSLRRASSFLSDSSWGYNEVAGLVSVSEISVSGSSKCLDSGRKPCRGDSAYGYRYKLDVVWKKIWKVVTHYLRRITASFVEQGCLFIDFPVQVRFRIDWRRV
jgi:hypothetical protein